MTEFEPMPETKDTAQLIPKGAEDATPAEVTDPDDPSYVEPAPEVVLVEGTEEAE